MVSISVQGRLTNVLGIPMVDGSVRYGSVLPFLQRHGVRALSARGPVSGVCSVVRPVKLSSGSGYVRRSRTMCVCAVVCERCRTSQPLRI